MEDFKISQLTNSAILYIYSEKESIDTEPEYQRESNIWTVKNRQLLIDTILNGYDIPKFYLHEFNPPRVVDNGGYYKYAIIDGKQRLTTIWNFIEGGFCLSEDFEFFRDTGVRAGGMSYADLSQYYPKLKVMFDSYTLSVVTIQTSNIARIEDMFYRLNEAEPLNAPEKRNAFGGNMAGVIREIAAHPFFVNRIPANKARYRELDLATKFLYIESRGGFTETKRDTLDSFVRNNKETPREHLEALKARVVEVLDSMFGVFNDSDRLLKTVGAVITYYYTFREALNEGWPENITRERLLEFESDRLRNRRLAEDDLDYNISLVKFDDYAQSSNDAMANEIRCAILKSYLAGEN